MKGKPWEYIFIVDMEGHQNDVSVAGALAEAGSVAASHKVLGSFPRALEVGADPGSASQKRSS
jgi:prephenate dehydratase